MRAAGGERRGNLFDDIWIRASFHLLEHCRRGDARRHSSGSRSRLGQSEGPRGLGLLGHQVGVHEFIVCDPGFSEVRDEPLEIVEGEKASGVSRSLGEELEDVFFGDLWQHCPTFGFLQVSIRLRDEGLLFVRGKKPEVGFLVEVDADDVLPLDLNTHFVQFPHTQLMTPFEPSPQHLVFIEGAVESVGEQSTSRQRVLERGGEDKVQNVIQPDLKFVKLLTRLGRATGVSCPLLGLLLPQEVLQTVANPLVAIHGSYDTQLPRLWISTA